MATILFAIGVAVAAVLLGLLVLTLLFRPLRIWPTPGTGSWQGYVFWPLFRSLNVLCFAVARRRPDAELLGQQRQEEQAEQRYCDHCSDREQHRGHADPHPAGLLPSECILV